MSAFQYRRTRGSAAVFLCVMLAACGGSAVPGPDAASDAAAPTQSAEAAAATPTVGVSAGVGAVVAPQLAVDTASYQLVSSQRTGRTTFRYTYRVNVVNAGGPVRNVRATVTSSAASTTIIDAEVAFGDLAGAGTVASSDTFTIQQDRGVAFAPGALGWTVNFDGETGAVTVDKSYAFFTAIGQTAALKAAVVDIDGLTISPAVQWRSTAPDAVAVDATGRLIAKKIGSAQIFAEVDGISSAPTLVIVARPVPGAMLVNDAQIVSVGAPISLVADEPPELGSRFDAVLNGVPAPPVGSVLLAAETTPLAGRVLSSRADGANLVVTLETVPIYEALAEYSIDWQIDLSAYPLVPIEGDAQASAASAQGYARASERATIQQVRPALFGDSDLLEAFKPFSCDASLSGKLIDPPLVVKPAVNFTLDVLALGGRSRVVLAGTLDLETTIALKLVANLTAKGECKTQAKFSLPVFGVVSVFLMPTVRVGLGAAVESELKVVAAEVGVSGNVGFTTRFGWDCDDAAGLCSDIQEFVPRNTLRPKAEFPFDGAQAFGGEAKVSGEFFGLVGLDATFGTILQFGLVEAKFGPKQTFSFKSENDSAIDRAYGSNYELTLEGEIAPGAGLSRVIKDLVRVAPPKFSFSVNKAKSTSPMGTLTVDRSNALPGQVVRFTVDLKQDTTSYPVVGYNVNLVEIWRKQPQLPFFELWKTIAPTASNQSRFVYDWTPSRADEGESEFALFVDTNVFQLLSLPAPSVEGGVDPRTTVTVQPGCVPPNGPAALRARAARVSGEFATPSAEPQVCVDAWTGSSSVEVVGQYEAVASITWRKVGVSPENPAIFIYLPSGSVTVTDRLVAQSGCTISPQQFVVDGFPPDNVGLTVDYQTTPARVAGIGELNRDVTVTCPSGSFTLPLNFNWFSYNGFLAEDGLSFSGTENLPGRKSSFSFTRP